MLHSSVDCCFVLPYSLIKPHIRKISVNEKIVCSGLDWLTLPLRLMPVFNLIIMACALPHSFKVKLFCVRARGWHSLKMQPLLNVPCSADLEMDAFYLILRERSHLFRAESLGLPPHNKAHHFISSASHSHIPYNVKVRNLCISERKVFHFYKPQ